MEARNRPLEDWFSEIGNGYLALPRFQRHEAWSHKQVSALLDTVLNQLPAGAVLTLEVGDEKPFISRAVVGAPDLSESETSYLLDGQQRLTSLWRSLHANYPDRMFFIKENDNGTYSTESIGRWLHKSGSLYPLWADDPQKQRERKLIPLNLLCPNLDSETTSKEWIKAASKNTDELIALTELVGKLRPLFANFNIPFLSLPKTTSKDVALDLSLIHI